MIVFTWWVAVCWERGQRNLNTNICPPPLGLNLDTLSSVSFLLPFPFCFLCQIHIQRCFEHNTNTARANYNCTWILLCDIDVLLAWTFQIDLWEVKGISMWLFFPAYPPLSLVSVEGNTLFFPSPRVSIFIPCPLHPYLNLTYWWIPLHAQCSLAETTAQFSTAGYEFIGFPRGQRQRDAECGEKMSLSTDLNALCTWGIVMSNGRKGGSWDMIQGSPQVSRTQWWYAYGMDSKEGRELWWKECKRASRLSLFNFQLQIIPAAWSWTWSLLIWAVSFEMG